MDHATTVRELVEPALSDQGLSVFDIEYTGGRLVVLVDRDGGVDLEALTQANHLVSDLLDEHDPIPDDSFLLEVSSPGLERPLRTPAHFTWAVGQTINLKLDATVEGDRRLEGELEAADADGITVAGRRIAYADIERARTVFAWGPAPKPTGGSPKKPHPKTTNAKAKS